jgi:hypothetical protein
MVFPVGFYDTEGRHLSGVIGRDVLADSLVFGFDRDQGIATLSTVKAFAPPPGAIAISYEHVFGRATNISGKDPDPLVVIRPDPVAGVKGVLDRPQAQVPARLQDKERAGLRLPDVTPMPRRVANARVGGAVFSMHLDLGATVSQLREASWGKAGLTASGLTASGGELRLVDETATVRRISSVGRAPSVALGAASSRAMFAPYIERRFETPVDGALGLDFFQPYAVYANWDGNAYLLKPRSDAAATTTARLGRWGAYLPACPSAGCVSTEVAASEEGVALRVARDAAAAGRDLEVLLSVAPAGGKPARRVVVELPRAADRVAGLLSADYLGAAVTVLDASPFPRTCGDGTGCILPLGPDAATGLEAALRDPGAPAAVPEPEEPAAPATAAVPIAAPVAPRMAIDKLHRRTGERNIPPSAAVQSAGQPAAAIVRVCMDAGGKVELTKLVKSSNVPAYDDELQATIKATWTFDPVEIDGAPAPVCTQVTFVGH